MDKGWGEREGPPFPHPSMQPSTHPPTYPPPRYSNLPFKLSSDELYDIFGKYGPIRQVKLFCVWGKRGGGGGRACVDLVHTSILFRATHPPFTTQKQIRVGSANENRGKAFVIYEDIYDAKEALEHLNGFNVCGRYVHCIPRFHSVRCPPHPSTHPPTLFLLIDTKRYLVVLYFHPEKEQKRMNLEKQRKEVEELRKMVEAGRSK